jgi:SAM-dependent methyltransferase
MNEQTDIQKRWIEYYERVAANPRPPRELFFRTIKRLKNEGVVNGVAVDLGCGIGTETMELLRQGWHVLSVDAQQEAIDYLGQHMPDEYKDRWQSFCGSFETVDFPECEFIWAGNCLPFCPPEHLNTVLTNIVNALKPGGRFSGDFFGPRHTWANNENLNFFAKDDLISAFPTLEVEFWNEGEGELITTLDELVNWHAHTIVMRKPQE